MINPMIRAITIYPFKSLDGVSLAEAEVAEGGCLLHDREFAIIDQNGNFVNGKSNPLVHSLRSEIDFQSGIISIRSTHESTFSHFHLHKEKNELEQYLSDYFGINVFLLHDRTGRFLDIPDMSGLTILSTESLKAVSNWFGISLEESRRRFRATIELEGVPAFWEDHLFAEPGSVVEFKLGDVKVIGISPRERCVVPSRNPETGEVIRGFQRSFAQHRADVLPEWSALNEYRHHYFLSVDCHIPDSEVGKKIEVGNDLKITGAKLKH